MNTIVYRTCDVLIVGAGLAGLRAGISALEHSRDLQVGLAAQGLGPSGSSFTNPNNTLGMMVCHNDREKELFVKTAVDIAAPGVIDPELTAVLAEESESMYRDLVQGGLTFTKNVRGKDRRHAACFLRRPRMAYVFTHLSSAFFSMKNRFRKRGLMWEGLCLEELITNDEHRIIGAVFDEQRTGQTWAVQCQSLVLATGGAAALFPRTLTDSDNLGMPLSLMHRAGATLVNMNYLQYLWYKTESGNHWPCWQIGVPGTRVRTLDGREIPVPDRIRDLCGQRSHHVPVAHGRDDSALDNFLLDHAACDGTLAVGLPDNTWQTVGLYAHALNGGVRIDTQGRTGIPGLFACGECTGGMHGANRVGGAMVMSTQVFGKRAGTSAARSAHDSGLEPGKRFLDRVKDLKRRHLSDPDERRRGLALLQAILAGSEGPFPRPDQARRLRDILALAHGARDRYLTLALECARLILEKRP